jgi:hypothetical protein
MAFALRNLEGKTKGSIGNVTFYMYRNINIVRAKASHIKNPRTQAQQINRSNIAPCISAYQSLKPLLYQSLNNRPDNYNVFHQFASQNLNIAFTNGIFQPENFIISGNCFENDVFDYELLQSGINNIKFSWAPSVIGYKENSDILCIAYYNSLSHDFKYINSSCTRDIGYFNCKLQLEPANSKTSIYLFFVKNNLSDSGNHTLIELINN